MSEYIDRLAARVMSDIHRGVTFRHGMSHFVELIKATITEMDSKLDRIEALAGKIEDKQ